MASCCYCQSEQGGRGHKLPSESIHTTKATCCARQRQRELESRDQRGDSGRQKNLGISWTLHALKSVNGGGSVNWHRPPSFTPWWRANWQHQINWCMIQVARRPWTRTESCFKWARGGFKNRSAVNNTGKTLNHPEFWEQWTLVKTILLLGELDWTPMGLIWAGLGHYSVVIHSNTHACKHQRARTHHTYRFEHH